MAESDDRQLAPLPVQVVNTGSAQDSGANPRSGIALCLSGGGYRAMLFHVGSLWRLNELGYLPQLARISSVSGGSIAAGVLGLNWAKLAFDRSGVATAFAQSVVTPIRALASQTIDVGAIVLGLLLPGSISERIVDAYRRVLFGDATLQDLPPDPPRFVINATSVQSGVLFRFSRPFAADYRVGMIRNPTIGLAQAVAASSAFPPVLSPTRLDLDPAKWDPPSGQDSEDLHYGDFLAHAVLTDGGVYDNLGLETAWKEYKTILVSDGGGGMDPDEKPDTDWARHALRVNDIIDNQVRSLRTRQLIGSYGLEDGNPLKRSGTYWGIRSDISRCAAQRSLRCPLERTMALAATPTRLKALDAATQERLINWGYAICDAAMRTHVVDRAAPVGFPYPASGV